MFRAVVILGIIISGAIFAGFYYVVNSDARGGIVPQATPLNPLVEITSSSDSGYYRFTGEIKLPHSCYRLLTSVKLKESDPTVARIDLTSQDITETSSACARYPTRYDFDLIQAGDASLRPELTLDGVTIPVQVVLKPWDSFRSAIPPVNGTR